MDCWRSFKRKSFAGTMSYVCHWARFCVSVCLIFAAVALPSGAAFAIEIFGIKLFEGDKAEQAAFEVPDPVTYELDLVIAGDDDNRALRNELESASTLFSQTNEPASGQIGLISRARNDRERLIATLYTQGRYGGTVDISINNRPLGDVADTLTYGPDDLVTDVPVKIEVNPGPEFTFGHVDLKQDEITPGVPATLSTYGVVSGEPAESGRILSAEAQIVEAYRARGFPYAMIVDRQVVADHANSTLDVVISVEPGPAATIGRATVSGLERTDPAFAQMMAQVPTGAPYSPKEVRKITERLRELGIFGSVVVTEGETLDENGQIPLTIEVSERKSRVIGAGVTYTSTEGLGAEGYWRHRNLFGRGETLSVEGGVGRVLSNGFDDLDYTAAVGFGKPGVLGPSTRFDSRLAFEHLNPESFTTTTISFENTLTREFSDRLTGSAGVTVEYSNILDAFGEQDFLLVGVPLTIEYDSRDDPANPSRGIHAQFSSEPLFDVIGNNAFWINQGSVATYQRVDEGGRLILAARLAAGSIVGANIDSIPANRRFFPGGGGSVRGFAYRNIGPRDVDGEVTGGRSFIEGQLEARIKVTDKIGVVPFVDVGASYAREIPDFSENFSVGVGAGIRYFTPIGPLRFDVAVPLNPENGDPDVAFYIGLSQSF